jgi:hypothetical protein
MLKETGRKANKRRLLNRLMREAGAPVPRKRDIREAIESDISTRPAGRPNYIQRFTADAVAAPAPTMRGAFPEAEVSFPEDLAKGVTCIPDLNDRHVVAAAIFGAANIIVTLNKKHFPASCIEQYSLSCQTPDEFLVRVFSLDPELVLEKVDWQAATLGQERSFIVQQLRKMTPLFAGLLEEGFIGG